jgi:hypothetical protein
LGAWVAVTRQVPGSVALRFATLPVTVTVQPVAVPLTAVKAEVAVLDPPEVVNAKGDVKGPESEVTTRGGFVVSVVDETV